MLKFFIKSLLLLIVFQAAGQTRDTIPEKLVDTTRYKQRYGLRVGLDVFAPVYSLFNADFQSFELMADYRLTHRLWVAGEWGYTDNLSHTDYIDFNTKGSFYKLGADYNTYNNWAGMENMVYVGLRYGFSIFDQTITRYVINNDPFLPPVINNEPITYKNLTGHWIEGIIGIKVETFKNLYMGMAFSGKYKIFAKEPDNFKNMYMPGFDRVSVNNYGFGFTYSLSYLIPFYRK